MNGQATQLQNGNMLAVTHYLFPSIYYTMLPQVCNQKEAHETIKISELGTEELIFESPLLLMSKTLDSYIPVTKDFEIDQITIRDHEGVLHYRSHSPSEKIQLTHLASGTYILSGINERGEVVSVIFRKA
jgi:ABC-type oligopeptide transport system ATPase subunit